MINLQQLKMLAEAATPGQWTAAYDPEVHPGLQHGVKAPPGLYVADCCDNAGPLRIGQGIKNAAYIAAAGPETALALIARIADLQAKLATSGQRPAPCATSCEANAFYIELRSRDSRIADLEAKLAAAENGFDQMKCTAKRNFDAETAEIARHRKTVDKLAAAEARTAPAQAGVALDAERAALRDMDRISMQFAADLVQMHSDTIKGRDYLQRAAIIERVVKWRQEWDANSAARPPVARAQQAGATQPGMLTDEQISGIAMKIYGTSATQQEHAYARAILAASATPGYTPPDWCPECHARESTPDSASPAAVPAPEKCGACNGLGWVSRDPDIGTEQECFSCGGSGESDASPAAQEDAARLDFVIDQQAFIMTIPKGKSGGVAGYQLMVQDEDEDYHELSGDGVMYRTKREAIDAAMSAAKTQ